MIAEIKARMEKYPRVTWVDEGTSLRILPTCPEGFEITVFEDEKRTVYFEAWHEECDSDEEVLNLVAFGLSGDSRIVEHSRGGKPHRWDLEHLTPEGWKHVSTMGLLFARFWGERSVRTLRNDLTLTAAQAQP